MKNVKIIAGSAHQELAKKVSKVLKVPLTPVDIRRFKDGEVYVRILESVRGQNVFIIQPTSPDANSNLMELLIMVDALKRSAPRKITAVVPYFGYSRQDRRSKPREPITAKLVAKMLETAGIDFLMTFDLHVPQQQGFFDIPSDNLDLVPVYAEHILKKKIKNVVFVAPDVGATNRARSIARVMDAPIAIVDKRRPKAGVAIVENVVGDVKGKNAILVDDMIDTGGTITKAAEILKKFGARDVYVMATHALLSGDAVDKLKNSVVKEFLLTDTVAISKEKRIKKLSVISIADVLAHAIKYQHTGSPMGKYYDKLYKAVERRVKK